MTELHSFSVPLKIKVTQNGVVVFERTFKNGPITFGRTTKNDVTLEFEFVSRSHCHIYEQNGKFYLEDLKSSNGIRVHDHKVSKIEITDVFNFNIVSLSISVERLVEEKTQPLAELPTASAVGTSTGQKMLPTMSNAAPAIVPVAPVQPQARPEPKLQVVQVEGNKIAEPVKNPGVTAARQPLPVRQLKASGKRKPVLDKDLTDDLSGHFAGVKQARAKKIEAIVMWHDQVYDVKEFGRNQRVIAGLGESANLHIPLHQDWALAKVDFDGLQCYVPANKDASLLRQGKNYAMGDLLGQQILQQRTIGYTMKIKDDEVLKIDLGSAISVILRYVPASRELTKATITEPERALKQALVTSFILHFFLAFMMILSAPNLDNVPKLKNVAPRYAKLLMEKPKPKPTPTPKPPEKKVVEKKPEPRKQQVVKAVKKPIKTPKVVAKVNKFPMEVKNPVKNAPPPTKVENLGALGALGAVSKNAPTNQVTAININPNAGGMPNKANTGGIIGALPSSNGTLVAGGGSSRVKTKGMGYGTGTGYGIQGLKGTAGSRGVAGAIVGQPKLASLAKEEGLTRAQVMAVVQKYLGEIQHCYERSLLASPNLAGRMEFEWDISAGGSVTSVRVKRSTVAGGDSLGECVKGIFAGMQFPKATNGATTTPNIGFPFGRM